MKILRNVYLNFSYIIAITIIIILSVIEKLIYTLCC